MNFMQWLNEVGGYAGQGGLYPAEVAPMPPNIPPSAMPQTLNQIRPAVPMHQSVQDFKTKLNNYLRQQLQQPAVERLGQLGVVGNEIVITKNTDRQQMKFNPNDPKSIRRAGDWLAT